MKIHKISRLVSISGIIILAVALFIFVISKPSIGKINPPQTDHTTELLPTEKWYTDDNINFTYGAKYELRAVKAGSGNQPEVINLLGTKGDSSMWTITIKKIDYTDLSEVSGVQLRRIKSEDYLEKNLEIDQTSGLFFKKISSSEFTALAIKNGKLITMALTVNSNDTGKEAEFLSFIKTLRIN
ncbi:MAG: hypothetical protein WC841_05860 [Candidatus Shapirobacteria bacterium]|jgi:hypothetical protein